MSLLHEAADANDVEALQRLLDEAPGVVNEVGMRPYLM